MPKYIIGFQSLVINGEKYLPNSEIELTNDEAKSYGDGVKFIEKQEVKEMEKPSKDKMIKKAKKK